jgi:hypothetical protein
MRMYFPQAKFSKNRSYPAMNRANLIPARGGKIDSY